MNITVIGTGYVGLISGLCFAKLGHKVACVDIDQKRISDLDQGELPFYEPGLIELLTETQEAGRVLFTTRLKDILSDTDVVFLAVGTPSLPNGHADLSAIKSVAKQIGEHLDREMIVVTKSTVPVGTNKKILEIIQDTLKEKGKTDLASLVSMVSVPEFLREGTAIKDFFHPDRIVIGSDDDVAAQVVSGLHDGIAAPVLHMSIESAELTKYAANAFLATKISFINEIANIAEIVGADVRDIAKAIGHDKRIGPHFLQAGMGYGGSCFPKDVSALNQTAGVHGYQFRLVSSVIDVNNAQLERFFSKVHHILNGVKGRKIGIWGLAFKSGTDDVRQSIAIEIVQRLLGQGAELCVYDPLAMESAKRVLGERVFYAPTAIDAAQGVDAVLVLTEWEGFRSVSFGAVQENMISPIIIDGKNSLADLDLQDKGFAYYGVGIQT